MTNDEALMEAMRRLEATTEELGRIKRALKAVQCGIPFNEAFNEELYMEAYDAKSCKRYTILLIRHFLEKRYSTDSDPDNHWNIEINVFRKNLMKEIDWSHYKKKMAKKKGYGHDTGPVIFLRDNLQEFYEIGITHYEDLRQESIDDHEPVTLPDISDIVPEECPWTLEQIIEGDIDEVVGLLPDLS